MHRVARGDANTRRASVAIAAIVAVMLTLPAGASATRTASPASVDLGTIKSAPGGGRAAAAVTYGISGDEKDRYAYPRASGGAPDGSTQFSVDGGDCFSVFPPLPLTPASCTIVIQFDYAQWARGLSAGTLVIDGDTDFSTADDELTVPLLANVLPWSKRRKCKRKRRTAAAATKRKCPKKMSRG